MTVIDGSLLLRGKYRENWRVKNSGEKDRKISKAIGLEKNPYRIFCVYMNVIFYLCFIFSDIYSFSFLLVCTRCCYCQCYCCCCCFLSFYIVFTNGWALFSLSRSLLPFLYWNFPEFFFVLIQMALQLDSIEHKTSEQWHIHTHSEKERKKWNEFYTDTHTYTNQPPYIRYTSGKKLLWRKKTDKSKQMSRKFASMRQICIFGRTDEAEESVGYVCVKIDAISWTKNKMKSDPIHLGRFSSWINIGNWMNWTVIWLVLNYKLKFVFFSSLSQSLFSSLLHISSLRANHFWHSLLFFHSIWIIFGLHIISIILCMRIRCGPAWNAFHSLRNQSGKRKKSV